jgi:hypothetical protein
MVHSYQVIKHPLLDKTDHILLPHIIGLFVAFVTIILAPWGTGLLVKDSDLKISYLTRHLSNLSGPLSVVQRNGIELRKVDEDVLQRFLRLHPCKTRLRGGDMAALTALRGCVAEVIDNDTRNAPA